MFFLLIGYSLQSALRQSALHHDRAERWATPYGYVRALRAKTRRWLMRLARDQQRRRDIERPQALDDRLLADIGLARSDIRYAVSFGPLPGRLTPATEI
jgi:uncharacterized protein YjiS (DUF1127 family)